METSDRNNQIDEFNYSELIDLGKKFVTEEKILSQGEYNLNLSLLAPNIDSSSKIQALAIKTFIYFSMEKNLNILLHLTKKILKPDSKIFYEKKFDSSIIFCFVRMFYRTGSLSEAEYPYLAFYFLKMSKNLILDNPQLRGDSNSLEILEKSIGALYTSLSQKIDLIKGKFFHEENSNLKIKLKQILNSFENIHNSTPSDSLAETEDEDSFHNSKNDTNAEKYYLISANWMKNMFAFTNKYLKYDGTEKLPSFVKQAFNVGNVLNLYYSDDDSDLSMAGIYPGPVYNYSIMQFKNFWYDPEPSQSHTNIYLKKGMRENADFFYVKENGWKSIKEVFGFDFEIERKTATISNNNLIEIKVLVLNDKVRDKAVNLIIPRNIQISKELTIKELKVKIIRSIKHCLSDVNEDEISNVKVYFMHFGMSKKMELFELIYSYVNKQRSFKILAKEVNDDATKIEVNSNIYSYIRILSMHQVIY